MTPKAKPAAAIAVTAADKPRACTAKPFCSMPARWHIVAGVLSVRSCNLHAGAALTMIDKERSK